MFYKKNIAIIKSKYPNIFKQIENIETPQEMDKYPVIISNIGFPTVKITNENKSSFIHSRYNPVREAKSMIENCHIKNIDYYIIYGFGFGYHIEELLNRDPSINLYVFETNKYVFKLALENRDLSKMLLSENVHIILEEDIQVFATKLNGVLGLVNHHLIIHTPSLNAIPQSLIQIKYLLEDFKIKENTIEKFSEVMKYNFNENIKRYNHCISILFKKFNDIPIVIVSAGPSLLKNINLLSKAKGRCIIISVGTAIKPLLEAGIEPDLVIITDPQDIVVNQIENLWIEVPIIILSTTNHNILKKYQGIKFIAMQNGYPLAEQYVSHNNNNNNNNNKLVNTGGSVATTALDISIKLGCNPIVFVGQDLAFTNSETHIKGTYFYKKIEDTSNLRAIRGYDNGVVYTSKNLYQYLKWIENRIKIEEEKLFINATEGGAFIEGTIQMNLQKVISKYFSGQRWDFKQSLLEIIYNESNI